MLSEKFSHKRFGMGSLPSITSLMAFERAAARSSFAAAGDDLGRTPSAVSHAIKDLEAKLGVNLFERSGRTVRLTETGAFYLEAVQRALSGLQNATDHIRRAGDERVIRISALPFFTSAILLPNLARFEQSHPEYDLRIETTNAYADIMNGEVDIAVRFGQENSKDLKCEPLIAVSGQPVASPSYLENEPRIEMLEDFRHHALIHVRQNEDAWQQWYTAHGGQELRSRRSLSFDSLLGSIDAVKRGLGIGLAMHPLIEAYPGFGTDFVPVYDARRTEGMNYNFVCRKSAFGERRIQCVLEWLQSSLGTPQISARSKPRNSHSA